MSDLVLRGTKGAALTNAELDANLQGLSCDFYGPTAPATTFPGMTWADSTAGLLKRRSADGTAWVVESALFKGPPAPQWLAKAVGEPFALRGDLSGVSAPPTDDARFRYIKLTASDAYNTGVLTGESVSGSAPLIVATAVISLAQSPLNGQTINLWNTERRSPRAGNPGLLQDDAFQTHGFRIQVRTDSAPISSVVAGNYTPLGAPGGGTFDNAVVPVTLVYDVAGPTRVADETRGRNQGVTYYMRIM